PFHLESVYSSPAFDRLVQLDDVRYTFSEFAQNLRSVNVIQAGISILRKCYGKQLDLRPMAMLKVPDPKTGLLRFFKPVMNDEFIKVVHKGELPPLSTEKYQRLLSNIYDRDLWLEILPPENFSFQGFMFSRLVEVTEEESLSRLKRKLLKRDAVLDIDKVKELADLLRIYFNMADLQLGLAAVDYPQEFQVGHQYKIRFNILQQEVDDLTLPDFEKSIYQKAFKAKEVLLIEDLAALRSPTTLEQLLIAKGFRSVLLAPLVNKKDRVIGLVELASPEAYGLNSFVEVKFREILGLFRTAVVRSREEIDNRLEAIIRDRYTRLHSSVEWRFVNAAYNIFEQLSEGKEINPEPISFAGVYPLYGQLDIVSSSQIRNESIHADLMYNLQAARLVLVRSLDLIQFPLVNQVIMEIDQTLNKKATDFNNSDETAIVEFSHRLIVLPKLIEQWVYLSVQEL
ncbi:MAG: hypothetical protein AAFU03_15745, partial [Bacteroidota bacterium]